MAKPELSAEQIRKAREQARLTQAELARELDVSTRTVARWESEGARLSEAQKRRLAEVVAGIGGMGMAALGARAALAPLAPWLGGPLFGLAIAGVGAAWLARKSAGEVPASVSMPDVVRDALLTWADHLDLSPRKLRGAIVALLCSSGEAACGARQLRDLLARDEELPDTVRTTLLAAADGLDLSPRKLRTALFAVLNAAVAADLTDDVLLRLLSGSPATEHD